MFSLRKKTNSAYENEKETAVMGKVSFLQKLHAPLRNKIIGVALLIALFLNLGIWILLYMNIKPSPDPVFLHYNIYFGIDLIGDWYRIYIIPLSGLLIILVNYFVGVIMYSSKRILSYLIVIFTIPVNMFLALAAVLLAFINR
ncbi:MAG: hypothetical protein WC693_00085 [Patescibacteria group bacterium]|jgi:hypothetical protein